MDLSLQTQKIQCYCHQNHDLNVSYSGLVSSKHLKQKFIPFNKKIPSTTELKGKKISLKRKKNKRLPIEKNNEEGASFQFFSPKHNHSNLMISKPKYQNGQYSINIRKEKLKKQINKTEAKLEIPHQYPTLAQFYHSPIPQNKTQSYQQSPIPKNYPSFSFSKLNLNKLSSNQPEAKARAENFCVMDKIKKFQNSHHKQKKNKELPNEGKRLIPKEIESVFDEEQDHMSEVIGHGWESSSQEKELNDLPTKTILTTTTNYPHSEIKQSTNYRLDNH